MNRNSRGATLKTVIITSFMLLTLVGVMVLLAQKDSFIAVDSLLESDAQSAAHSAITLAQSELAQGNLTLNEPIRYVLDDEGMQGKVFRPEALIHFDKEKDHYSTNNLNSGSSVEGWNGALVPKRCIHLVSVGKAGAVQWVYQVTIGLPRYPFSVAANGTVQGTDLDIFGLKSIDDLEGGVQDDERRDTNVISNHKDGIGVTLGRNTTVQGDVVCAGEIQTRDGAIITGDRKDKADEQKLAVIDLSTYDPNNGAVPPAPYTPSLVKIAEGKARYTGNLNLGDLELDRGLLFVEGDLEISGRVKGEGAIVATGSITVTGQLNLESDFVALVAGGDVTIDGTGKGEGVPETPAGTRMQGLVYSNGQFSAKDATLVGAIVSAKVDGISSLDRVNMARAPEAGRMSIVIDTELERLAELTRSHRDGYTFRITLTDGPSFLLDPSNLSTLSVLADDIAITGETYTVEAYGPDGKPASSPPNFVNTDMRNKAEDWTSYVNSVKASTVVREEIFSIDLNSFLSIDSNLVPLLWKGGRLPR